MKSQGYDPVAAGLSVKSYSGDEAICLCPFHEDSHPSASLNIETGQFYCFSCGTASNIWKVAKKLGGYVEKRYVEKRKKEQTMEWRKLFLSPLAYGNEYLKSRGVTDEQVEKFRIRSAPSGIVFPITSRAGGDVGAVLRQYSGSVRYLTFGEKVPVWPAHLVEEIEPKTKVFVVEGIFGVLRADLAGVPAFATLGAMAKADISKYLGSFNTWVLFDHDFAGYVGAGRLLKALPSATVVVPGTEADELDEDDWLAYNVSALHTRSFGRLAKLSGDSKKFYRYVSYK